MEIKVVKIVPGLFVNMSRDIRELSVLRELGCSITILAKEGDCESSEYNLIGLTSRPLENFIHNLAFNRLVSLFLWAKHVRGQNPDIISCHDIICLFIGWMSTLFIKKKPLLVYDSHEFEYARDESRSRLSKFFVKHVERFLMKRSSLSIMVNDSIADEVVKLHHLNYRPLVVRNLPYKWNVNELTVENNRKLFYANHSIPSNASLAIYQGGLTKRRGIENAINAVSRIEGVYLLIMGMGEKHYVDSLKELSRELEVEKRVIFEPAVSYSELWKYTGIADMGLCILENVCLNHYYALPNKFSEYIQCKVPVIASDFPEMRKIVDLYGIGLCCNPGNIDSLVAAIYKMHTDIEYKNKCRNNLIQAKDELCWENERNILFTAYDKLIRQIQQ